MAGKQQYAERARSLAGIAANLSDDILAWRDVWWDRGYNTGGADPLGDADVTGAGVTAAELTGLVTFADALEVFLTANRAYINRIRSDM